MSGQDLGTLLGQFRSVRAEGFMREREREREREGGNRKLPAFL